MLIFWPRNALAGFGFKMQAFSRLVALLVRGSERSVLCILKTSAAFVPFWLSLATFSQELLLLGAYTMSKKVEDQAAWFHAQ